MSWRRTVIAFWLGAIMGGLITFTIFGLLGDMLGLTDGSALILLGVVAMAGVLDLIGKRPPGPKRQVNEDWLTRYRDWVTGVGFGFQLGSGLMTHVPVFAVWALVALAVLSGPPGASLIGIAFAIGRSLPLLLTKHVERPSALARLMSTFGRYNRIAVNALFGSYAVVLIVGAFLHV